MSHGQWVNHNNSFQGLSGRLFVAKLNDLVQDTINSFTDFVYQKFIHHEKGSFSLGWLGGGGGGGGG